MSIRSINPNYFLWLRLGIIVLILFLGLSLFAINYKAGAIFLFGVLLFPSGWGLLWIGKKTFLFLKRKRLILLLTGCSLLLVAVLGLFFIFSLGQLSNYPDGTQSPPPYIVINTDIKKYQASITPVDKKLSEFRLKEDVVFRYTSEFGADDTEKTLIIEGLNYLINDNERIRAAINKKLGFLLKSKNIIKLLNKSIELELERTISSQEAGFALKKISFTPLENIISSLPSINKSSPLDIELNNLPKGSFYQANEQKDIEKHNFLDNKKIEWSTDNISEEIEFAYFPFPYYYFSSILTLFAGISSLGNGIIILFGLVSATVTSEIIKPIIVEKIQESVKQRWDKVGENKEASTPLEPEVTANNSLPNEQPKASTTNEVPPQISTETNDESKQENP